MKALVMINYVLKIKEYRERTLLTQGQLAKILRVSATSVTRWETGKFQPAMQIKKKLNELFIKAEMSGD